MAEKFGNTWWSERWLQSLSHIDYSNRLPRGAAYARNGSVTKITINGNEIVAKVQDTRRYTVTIEVPEFTENEKSLFIDELLKQPLLIAALLNNQLLPQVMEIANKLNLAIFPTSWESFYMDCNCADVAVPCKHLAAVIYRLSREIDNDPFLVFRLHNLDILKELSVRGVGIDEKAMAVPNIAELIELTDDVASTFDEEQAYTHLSYGKLTDMSSILPQMLTDAPVFDSQYNFLSYYKRQIATLAKNAAIVLDDPSKIQWGVKTDEGEISKHDVLKRIVVSNSDVTSFYLNTLRSSCNFSVVAEMILKLDDEHIERYMPSVAAMYGLLRTALMLVKHGAMVPQVYTVRKSELMVRWLPAMIDENVAALVDKCSSIVPPDLITFIVRDKQNITEHRLKNAGYEALVVVLTQVVHALYRYDTKSDINDMFFGHERTIDMTEPGKSAIGSSIASWLSRFYISNEAFRHVIVVEDNDGTFSLSFAVEDTTVNNGLPIPLNSILTNDEYANKRFPIIQSLTIFSSQISGLDDYISRNATEPISYDARQLIDFLFKSMPMLKMLGVKIMLPKSLKKIARPKATIKVSGKDKERSYFSLSTLLDFEWRIAIGDELISVDEFKKLLKQSEQLIKIKGQYVYLSEADITQLMNMVESDKPTNAQLMQAVITGDFEGERIELSDELKKQIETINKLEQVSVPTEIKATLRPYQQTGYWWMYRNSKLGFGSIIADDMGLGKTLQVITLLQKLKNDAVLTSKAPALVIVPTALLFNWTKEIERFAPQLTSSIFHGASRSISSCKTDIVLTTYGVVRTDQSTLKKLKPSVLIIDEAQNIKNINTEQTKAVKAIAAPIKIAMSGTPVENRLSEFWSIMDFANKGLLGTIKLFSTNFGKPIQTDGNERVAERFRKMTAPFMMRRLKTDKSIISDLPDKIETNEYATLTKEQASLYEETVQKAMKTIEGITADDSKSLFKRSALVLQMMMSLKQICNHPTQFLKNEVYAPELSGKTEMLLSLLDTIVDRNEKVLIFTQFAEMGELLCRFINQRFDEQPMFYNGSCSVKERESMVERFQNNHSDRIFVLTIKSAGVGLNLTAATHVIHFDLWWNPAVEAQATDRAYRIGQNRNVQVHRFITRNTFEERIDEMIQSKKHLADMTVATGENWIGKLSNEELKDIFIGSKH